MKHSRILEIVLITALITSSFVSCANETSPEQLGTLQTEATEEPKPAGIFGDAEGAPYIEASTDFYGADFHVVARGYGKWICQDIYAEEYNAELINDTVFERNTLVEDKLNFHVSLETIDNDDMLYKTIVNMITANDDCTDLVWVNSANISNLAMNHYLRNLSAIPTLNLQNHWWDQNAVNSLNINGSIYFTTGEISIISKEAVYVMTFNKGLARDNNMVDFYDLVRDKKWTIDRFGELSTQISSDLDGNGKFNQEDLYGFMTYDSDYFGYLLAGGGSLAKIEDGIVKPNYNTENVINMLDKLYTIKADKSTFFFVDDKTATDMFVGDKVLFTFRTLINLNFYRNMETDYGILPLPMLNEEQDTYYSGEHYYGLSLIGIPVISASAEQTGTILEALCYVSQDTLTPAFYDTTLKGKYFRDEESGEMLDIIFANRVYDIGYFNDWGGIGSKLIQLSTKNKNTFASTFASSKEAYDKDFLNALEAFGVDSPDIDQ